MKKLSLISYSLIFLLNFFILSASEYKKIQGYAKVIDGDSIIIKNKRIRLFGIDAPEKNQICKKNGAQYKCGIRSTNSLKFLINNKKLICSYKNKDRYGRILGECDLLESWNDNNSYIASGILNDIMVSSGFAVAYVRYSKKYLQSEKKAKILKKGIWAGEFDRPEDWRRKYN